MSTIIYITRYVDNIAQSPIPFIADDPNMSDVFYAVIDAMYEELYDTYTAQSITGFEVELVIDGVIEQLYSSAMSASLLLMYVAVLDDGELVLTNKTRIITLPYDYLVDVIDIEIPIAA